MEHIDINWYGNLFIIPWVNRDVAKQQSYDNNLLFLKITNVKAQKRAERTHIKSTCNFWEVVFREVILEISVYRMFIMTVNNHNLKYMRKVTIRLYEISKIIKVNCEISKIITIIKHIKMAVIWEKESHVWWHMTVIPATWEVYVRGGLQFEAGLSRKVKHYLVNN
jgi:hypothetical protein